MTATTAKRKTDSTLGALVAHPLRCKLWTRFAERTASSSDIARELGLCVSNVSYHVRSLVDAGVIEAVGSRPVRGSVETFYRAVQPPHFSSEEFAALSSEERRAFAETVFSLCAANLATSIDGGALFERPDGHLSRVPLRVDEQGWSRLVEIFDRALEEVLEVKQEAELRLASRAEDAVPVVAFATCFEMPR